MNTAETIAISLIVPFLTGLSWLAYKHSSFPEINEIINTIESIEISLLWPVIGYFALLIYLTFLDNIEYFLKKDKKNYSE